MKLAIFCYLLARSCDSANHGAGSHLKGSKGLVLGEIRTIIEIFTQILHATCRLILLLAVQDQSATCHHSSFSVVLRKQWCVAQSISFLFYDLWNQILLGVLGTHTLPDYRRQTQFKLNLWSQRIPHNPKYWVWHQNLISKMSQLHSLKLSLASYCPSALFIAFRYLWGPWKWS